MQVGIDMSAVSPPLNPEERSLVHELYLVHNAQVGLDSVSLSSIHVAFMLGWVGAAY